MTRYDIGDSHHLLDGKTQIRRYRWGLRAFEWLKLNLVSDHALDAETLAVLEASISRDVTAQRVWRLTIWTTSGERLEANIGL